MPILHLAKGDANNRIWHANSLTRLSEFDYAARAGGTGGANC